MHHSPILKFHYYMYFVDCCELRLYEIKQTEIKQKFYV